MRIKTMLVNVRKAVQFTYSPEIGIKLCSFQYKNTMWQQDRVKNFTKIQKCSQSYITSYPAFSKQNVYT